MLSARRVLRKLHICPLNSPRGLCSQSPLISQVPHPISFQHLLPTLPSSVPPSPASLFSVVLRTKPTGARVRAKSLQWCLTLCDPRTIARQTPLFIGFSRQEYWSGLPGSPPGDLSNPGIKPASPALQKGSLPLSHQGRQADR